ncbi:conjugal transfer protein [Clostridium botulinum]|nr:conjugal transfer protein [Clostridium botulinum]NFB58570.1 conjugal transfer protein [Clostridium botulinum]
MNLQSISQRICLEGTVNAAMIGEVNEFLKTFFRLYPTATEKELSYYVKNNVLKPIGKNLFAFFFEILNLYN